MLGHFKYVLATLQEYPCFIVYNVKAYMLAKFENQMHVIYLLIYN